MNIDYEAAAKVLRTWFDGGFNGDHVLASNIVNAALEGNVLYRIHETKMKLPPEIHRMKAQGWLVQVYPPPKEEHDAT